MRKFKKKVQEANLIQEIRERKEYVKPAKRRKAKAQGLELGGLKKQAKRLESLVTNVFA